MINNHNAVSWVNLVNVSSKTTESFDSITPEHIGCLNHFNTYSASYQLNNYYYRFV